MKQTRWLVKTTLMLFVLTCVVQAGGTPPPGRETRSLLDQYMQGQVRVFNFNGNVLVARKGSVIYQKSFGYGNYDSKEALDKDSLFDAGSIGKQFTAMAILLLKEQGKLGFDDRLQKYFPELPYPEVTIRHLLTHTSGLPEYFDLVLKKWDLEKVANNREVIGLLASEKPAAYFAPGESQKYSNTAFLLLAAIVEKISGQSWTEFVTGQILKPLGMTESKAYNLRLAGKLPVAGIVYGFLYAETEKKYVLPETLPQYKGFHAFDDIYGDGGINMSTGDLLKWDRALKNHTLISERTQKEMLSVQSTNASATPPISFGYGLRIGKNEFGNYFFSTGHWPGFRSMYIRYVDADLTVIVFSNNESQSEFIADGLAAIALNHNVVLPYEHKEAQAKAPELDRYIGRYRFTKLRENYMTTWPTAIIRKGEKLFLHLEGSADREDIELKPESATRLFYADNTDRQLEFETDAAGKLIKVWQITWGVRHEATKLDGPLGDK